MASRSYDLIIYGAYGYTGTLTVQHLLSKECPHSNLKWAVAGRSKAKLDALAAKFSADRRIDTIVASVDDIASLDAMCQQTKILLTFAGPYLKCGIPIVDACVRNDTHYMDITGEMHFIRKLVDTYHTTAKNKRIAIINSCGFDCVPSDMGSLMMHEHVAEASGAKETITSMEGYYTLIGGISPSGGTAATLSSTALTSSAEDHNPLSINPPQFRSGIPAPERKGMCYTKAIGQWSGPFLMACENERIVRRTNCLLGRPQVSYAEAITGSFWAVLGEFIQFWAINLLLPIAFFNRIVMLFLPKPGDGPSPKEKLGSQYRATFVARTSAGKMYKGEWYDRRNAYDTTAVFVIEAVACLRSLESEGKGSLINYGVVTPASALGAAYLERLKKGCGIRTEVAAIANAQKRK